MQTDVIQMVFSIAALVFSVVAHEVSHGYMAQHLGDPTARLSGRLTMNPIKHIDPVGSVLVPLVLALSHTGFVFGWAKPVPYNPYNLKDQRWGEAKVAFAGPLTNFVIAVVFGLFIRFFGGSIAASGTLAFIGSIVLVNLVLTVFNLFPLPPLDGSKVLASILPMRYRYVMEYLERYYLVFLLIFVFFLWDRIVPVIFALMHLIVGTDGMRLLVGG